MSAVFMITSEPDQPLVLVPRNQHGTPSRSIDEVRAALSHRAIFLSASENVPRKDEADNIAPSIRQRHEHYHKLAPDWTDVFLDDIQRPENQRPRHVLRAVSWLSAFAFQRDYTLIFGGHPAISPMVVELARRHLHDADALRVVVFQSENFASVIPAATEDIGRSSHGCMLTAPARGNPQRQTKSEIKNESLSLMRQLMLSSPGLRAAVYIGGMGGLLEESYVFGDRHSHAPRYAIGSTGGAAKYLLDSLPHEHGGRSASFELLTVLGTTQSYPAVMERIFDDIESEPW